MEKQRPNWRNAFLDVIENPEQHQHQKIYYQDENILVIYDLFPKSQQHLLILPKKLKIDSIRELKKEHLSLLKLMHTRAEWVAESLKKQSNSKDMNFRLGYHSIPSMRLLHLHVISQDFDSPSLKNIKHWNSFNTPFFVESSLVISTLEEKGTFELDEGQYESYLKLPLKCNQCGRTFKEFRQLKVHKAEENATNRIN